MTSVGERDNVFIERHNILHFADLLETELNPAKRTILLKLLAEERAKLESHKLKNKSE